VTIIRDNVIKKLFIINNNINKIVLLLLLSNQLFRAISDNDKLGKKSLLMEIRKITNLSSGSNLTQQYFLVNPKNL